jgi:hypothetical protein
MERGVPGISQAVLYCPPYLGVPDILRREEGGSALGGFHYVAGDVKSSFRPRSDQALQVTFYSELLGEVQGRRPDHGYLVLRDGREERVDVGALFLVLEEVLGEMESLLADGSASRPHRSLTCRDCGWREVCSESRAIYWIPGLTRSVRRLVDQAGLGSLEALSAIDPRALGRQGLLPEATWQRVRWGAEALRAGRAIRVREPRLQGLKGKGLPVAVLRDPFDQRFPAFAGPESSEVALDAEEEEGAFRRLVAELRRPARDESLCHSGAWIAALHHFAPRALDLAEELAALEARSVNLMAIVRGAWVFPAPVASPEEALAWIDGRALEPGAAAEPDVALRLAERNGEALRARAESERAGLQNLLDHLHRAFSGSA